MPPFMLLIKPAAADCNLQCEYCFYLDRARLYPDPTRHRMDGQVLERLVQSFLATDQPQHVFCWQGGEPTLLGLDFYRAVTSLQQRHGRAGTVIANSLQTNAIRMNDPLAAHFGQFRFLVGCSVDGPAELHDRYRRFRSGQPSFADTWRGIETLRRHRVAVNVLVLVSQANVRRAREVYEFLTDHGLYQQQYIPCVEFDAQGKLLPFAISGAEWGAFLCELFDVWHHSGLARVTIRDFDALVQRLVTGETVMCRLGRNCCQYLVVEHNGDIYPCDFFVDTPYLLGNVLETSWEQALAHPIYRNFGARKSRWHETCDDCEQLALCHGDCLKFRGTERFQSGDLSWLCAGWRRFHAHAGPRLQALADEVQRRRRAVTVSPTPEIGAATLERTRRDPGRNDPCPCGSGRKFKRCCGG
ncbi:MAG: anaerobic sulfatase maturase [bacterium]